MSCGTDQELRLNPESSWSGQGAMLVGISSRQQLDWAWLRAMLERCDPESIWTRSGDSDQSLSDGDGWCGQ